MKIVPYGRLSNVLIASLAGGLLSGCSANFVSSPVAPEQVPIGNIQGSVHGGQAPVSGAHIYMLAAATSGYGNHVTSLINSTAPNAFEDGNGNYYVVTDANGNFAVGGDYTCTVGQQVYMVAYGGNPGLSGSVNNGAIVQMAGLGQCPAAGNMAALVPYLVINEVTTVAFAYAMGGFGSNAFFIGSNAPTATSPGAIAIANAMANSKNIVNLWPGTAPAVTNGNANSINPQAKINALANILAACVNTSSASSAQCTALFNTALSPGGLPATDEANAIFNIVHMPANTTTYPTHVNDIWGLTASNQVFTPTLPSAPTDWTMPVIYKNLVSIPGTTGNQITSGPFNMAFDADGNAWIGDRVKGVVEVGPQGAASTFNSGFGMIKGVAVSPADGTIWAADYANNVVKVLDPTGAVVATLTAGFGGKTNPRQPILTSFALDPTTGFMGYVGIEQVPGIVLYEAKPATPYAYTKSGSAELGSNGFPDVDTPGWIAVDQTGRAWLPSTDTAFTGNWAVTWKNGARAAKADEAPGPESYSTASDSNSNIWLTTNTGTATLEEIRTPGNTVTSTFTGGGMNEPYKLAVDGGDTIWIANDGANTLSAWSQVNGAWLASSGFSTSAASGTGCVVLGVDGSGNVWTGNADGSVTQLLGLATPTATPFYGGMTVITGTAPNQTTVITAGNLGSKP